MKAGSTTIQNILWRFSSSRNLTTMLFHDKFPYPSPDLCSHLLLLKPGQKACDGSVRHDVMAEHSVYNSSAVKLALPRNTASIAIVREPLSHLRSVFKFFNLAKRWEIEDTNALDDPVKPFLQNTWLFAQRNKLPIRHNTQNRIAFEFGYADWKYQYPPEDFIDYLEFLDKQFDLVLILENLHESLILMKRRFCWSMKDIIYLPLRKALPKKEKVEELDGSNEETELELIRAARDWSSTDTALYDFFIVRLREKMEEQSHDFEGEVTWFNHVIKTVQDFCAGICKEVENIRTRDKKTVAELYTVLNAKTQIRESRWNKGFAISGQDCMKMALDPNVYRAVELSKQLPEVCSDKASDAAQKLAQRMNFDKVFCGIEGESFPFSALISDEVALSKLLLYCPSQPS